MFINIIKQISKINSSKSQLLNGVSLVMAETAAIRNVQAPNNCIYCTNVPSAILQDSKRPRKYQESIIKVNEFIAEPPHCPFNPIQILCPRSSINTVCKSVLLLNSLKPLPPPLPPQPLPHPNRAVQPTTKPIKRPNTCLVNKPLFHRHVDHSQRAVNYRMFNNLRQWETVNRDRTGFNFTIISYNVLAQDLVLNHPYLYSNHNPRVLAWNVRWNNLLSEIRLFNPDILCLQEVQSSHLEEYFSTLESTGYKGLFKKRTGERTDGCAIYYKYNKMKIIEHTSVEYNQPNVSVLDRDNIAIIVKFAPVEQPQEEFVVATTHLLYNPRRHDVRLAQTQLLLAEIDRMAFKPEKDDIYLPVLLMGDFNSQPYSAVYRLIRNREVSLENITRIGSPTGKKHLVPTTLGITNQCQHANLLEKRKENQTISRTEEINLININHPEKSQEDNNGRTSNGDLDPNLFSSGTLSHKFPLQSVYQHFIKGDTEGTTYQDEWVTVDYIFYSSNKGKRGFKLLERFKLPMRSDLEQIGYKIPNEMLGSDHFSLVAKFKLEYF